MKKHVIIATLGFIPGLLVYYFLGYTHLSGGAGFPFQAGFCAGLVGVGISYAVWAISSQLDRWIPWNNRPGIRLIAGLISYVGATLMILWLLQMLLTPLLGQGFGFIFEESSVLIKFLIIIFLVYLIFSVIYFALYSYYYYARTKVKSLRLEGKQIELQFKALKTQLSPHYLFNSLSAISMLIHRDAQSAEKFIRNLANSYRYTLDSYNKQWVSLKRELEFIESYRELLVSRFGEYIQFSVNLPDALMGSRVPPLTLQMLVENAIKHNSADARHNLRISIKADKDWIVISNNRTDTPQRVSSFGIGLTNISARYEILSGRNIQVEDGNHFTVKLPIVA